jgi:hypothetical protein
MTKVQILDFKGADKQFNTRSVNNIIAILNFFRFFLYIHIVIGRSNSSRNRNKETYMRKKSVSIGFFR